MLYTVRYILMKKCRLLDAICGIHLYLPSLKCRCRLVLIRKQNHSLLTFAITNYFGLIKRHFIHFIIAAEWNGVKLPNFNGVRRMNLSVNYVTISSNDTPSPVMINWRNTYLLSNGPFGTYWEQTLSIFVKHNEFRNVRNIATSFLHTMCSYIAALRNIGSWSFTWKTRVHILHVQLAAYISFAITITWDTVLCIPNIFRRLNTI